MRASPGAWWRRFGVGGAVGRVRWRCCGNGGGGAGDVGWQRFGLNTCGYSCEEPVKRQPNALRFDRPSLSTHPPACCLPASRSVSLHLPRAAPASPCTCCRPTRAGSSTTTRGCTTCTTYSSCAPPRRPPPHPPLHPLPHPLPHPAAAVTCRWWLTPRGWATWLASSTIIVRRRTWRASTCAAVRRCGGGSCGVSEEGGGWDGGGRTAPEGGLWRVERNGGLGA